MSTSLATLGLAIQLTNAVGQAVKFRPMYTSSAVYLIKPFHKCTSYKSHIPRVEW